MDAYFEAMGLSDQINQARIKLQWKNTMGPVIAAKTTQLSIKNKVLYVSLSSPALRKELLYQREKLVKSLNQSVGTTVIDVPEFVFEEDYVDPTRRTVTEEEWNLNASVSNFVANFYASSNGEYLFATFISDGNAIEFNGEIIVFENGKRYKLEEIDGVWYAKEWNDFDIFPSFIPSGLSFDDFEYSEEMGSYVLKEKTESGLYYSLSFEDGVLLGFLAQESLDVSDPGYFEMFTFSVAEIGTAEIDVPEYVIVE
jgi:hypothetical protein